VLNSFSKSSANTFIYCDRDERWKEPGTSGVKGVLKTAWYDADNQISYNDDNALPGCKPGASPRGKVIVRQTYCNSQHQGRCAITLCDYGIYNDKISVSQESPNANLAANSQPNGIGKYSLLSTTLLHEALPTPAYCMRLNTHIVFLDYSHDSKRQFTQ
jgi:hypothetical protein